jgi:hypothetical protein
MPLLHRSPRAYWRIKHGMSVPLAAMLGAREDPAAPRQLVHVRVAASE